MVEKIPTCVQGAFRPETQYARQMKLDDPANPRWRHDNIIQLELDFPDRITQEFIGDDSTTSHVAPILDMAIDADWNDPYLWYTTESKKKRNV